MAQQTVLSSFLKSPEIQFANCEMLNNKTKVKMVPYIVSCSIRLQSTIFYVCTFRICRLCVCYADPAFLQTSVEIDVFIKAIAIDSRLSAANSLLTTGCQQRIRY